MVAKRCPTGSRKSETGKNCRKTSTKKKATKKKSVKKPEMKWWGRSYAY